MKIDSSLHYGYDFETYPDIFTAAFEHITTGEKWFFEISEERNDHTEFCDFIYMLSDNCASMVGYNNIGFDYPILHMIVTQGVNDYYTIFEKCQAIINSFNPWDHVVWESKWLVNQIDLYKIHHFDNNARRTSLKVLEFNMRSHNIEDLPFTPAQPVGRHNFPVLRHYNKHDVTETIKFYWHTVGALEMRAELSAKHNRNFTNHNDTKIGKDYFIMKLGDDICYYRDANNKKHPRQSIRNSINLDDVVFNYIQFDRPEFNGILNYFKAQTITQTKGVFNDVPMTSEQALAADHSTIKVSAINPVLVKQIVDCTDDTKQRAKEKKALRSAIAYNRPVKLSMVYEYMIDPPLHTFKYLASNLNCVVNGFGYDFGTGGIHGSVSSQTVVSDANHIILDIDVKSYYPNIGIKNKLYPEHLGAGFCDVYSDVYDQRVATVKKSPENAMLKLALNGVYGDSNNVYSPFYDPAYTMAITINGQLLLCMLAEKLIACELVEMIQINTDGLTIKIPRALEQWVNEICDWWEKFTLLELERVEYNRMFIRDVNNFIGEFTDGSLKRKGAYAHNRDDQGELPWNKDHGGLVIKKAAQAALVDGIDPADFIKSHNDYLDFMFRAKVPRSSCLVGDLNGADVPLANITRYYVTDDRGVGLVKIMPPLAKNPTKERRIGICVGWNVAPCNNLSDICLPINYDYYIQEAHKLIDPLR